jgi:peptidoglycan/LPS O-acetylase OafA/YrhL
LYLTHKGIIHITQNVFESIKADSNLMLLVCFITCFIAAYLLNIIIERPFMKLRNWVLKNQ